MNDVTQMKKDLGIFNNSDKFTEFQHLQPAVANSTIETKYFVNKEISAYCNELIAYLDTESPNDDGLKQIGRNSLEQIEDAMLDTEDREFCYELYQVIGNITGVTIEDESINMEDKLLNDMLRLLKNAGLNPDDFFPPGNSK